ncbi:hypothetical protein ACH429_09665 [Streptomyces pathocidini]|uniref:Uncharacterized protein n=1 Tax=Streptomyces pathocidini TaxID=1650571 RepID=A0ABW7UP04_9ACTN|nr:hypothetical protein [Streptomyces pathocidini]
MAPVLRSGFAIGLLVGAALLPVPTAFAAEHPSPDDRGRRAGSVTRPEGGGYGSGASSGRRAAGELRTRIAQVAGFDPGRGPGGDFDDGSWAVTLPDWMRIPDIHLRTRDPYEDSRSGDAAASRPRRPHFRDSSGASRTGPSAHGRHRDGSSRPAPSPSSGGKSKAVPEDDELEAAPHRPPVPYEQAPRKAEESAAAERGEATADPSDSVTPGSDPSLEDESGETLAQPTGPVLRVLPFGTGLALMGLGLGFIGLRLRRR